jgi:hypothetical protein
LAPELAQFSFVFEQLGDIAKELFDKFSGGNGGTVGAPEAGLQGVLDCALFAVGQLDDNFLGTTGCGGCVLGVVGVVGMGRI